jgi:tetratricopeptide (TPR) repeat protein
MVDEPKPRAFKGWQPAQLAALSIVCLTAGLLAGYFLRGSALRPVQAASVRADSASGSASTSASSSGSSSESPVSASASEGSLQNPAMPHKMPTLEELKRAADKKAAPLLEKLKSDPRNPQLENQIGLIYETAHQFKHAAGYFEKSLEYDPRNIGVRADYASCLYYTGDVDGALAQLKQSLFYDPKHAGTLLNIGIIEWQGKNDAEGAISAWEKLLRYHPDFPQKDKVQEMITQAKRGAKMPAGQKG